jgi:hypothetical protein
MFALCFDDVLLNRDNAGYAGGVVSGGATSAGAFRHSKYTFRA